MALASLPGAGGPPSSSIHDGVRMTLKQLRYLREVVRFHFNISSAAGSLSTSQPGVSKQIRLLEAELGFPIFTRNRDRIVELTALGKKVLAIAERVLNDTENLKKLVDEFTPAASGNFVIATTHTQARYALPEALKAFALRYPNIRVQLRQGNTSQIARSVVDGEADLAIATEALAMFHELVAIPCNSWNRCVITPAGHPLLSERRITLKSVARYPLIAYGTDVAAHGTILRAFERRGLVPNIVLSALDSDVIKACVASGLGIAIINGLAFDARHDASLRAVDASHLFKPSSTYVAIRRGNFLRSYMFDFLEIFSPRLSRHNVELALAG
jgi:LysR family cys regulon transcriptional activator